MKLLERLRRHVASHEVVGSQNCREARDWRDAVEEIEHLRADQRFPTLTVGMVTAMLAAVGEHDVSITSQRRRDIHKMWDAAKNWRPDPHGQSGATAGPVQAPRGQAGD